MKRLISLMLSLALMLALATPAFAASGTITAQQAADALHERELFNGTGTDANGRPVYDLDRAPTRHEAITMLVRLLGKTYEAESGTWPMPFTDVADWAKPYVGYAYANGLVGGTSATAFSGNQTVTAAQYLTFVLRALGYESGTDFQWDRAWELSDRIGLTNGQYHTGTVNFTRGDVAIISYQALQTCRKGTTTALLQILTEAGSIGQRVPAVQKNNIPADEMKELVKYYGGILEVRNSYNSSFLDEKVETKQDLKVQTAVIRSLTTVEIDGYNRMYTVCGSYDDTQNLKKYLQDMKTAFKEISVEASKNVLYTTIDEDIAYTRKFAEILGNLEDNGTWAMIVAEMKPFVDRYLESDGQ